MIDEQHFREEVRNLKALLRDDPSVRAQYDLDGDGQIDSAEWDHALQVLREELERRAPSEPQVVEPAVDTGAPGLVTCSEVAVKQLVEHREVFLGYETSNRYVFVEPTTGAELGGCDEESTGVGGFLSRQFLGPARPLTLNATDNSRGVWMEGRRPFHFLGFIQPPTMTVNWNHGPLGTIRRVWPLVFWRRYEIQVAGGDGLDLRVDGTLFRPWTFPVMKGGRQVACILKKWSGIGKEVFTDADTFLVRFEDAGLTESERRLLVMAALAIDFDFFEKNPGD